jgi:hypothetical protein
LSRKRIQGPKGLVFVIALTWASFSLGYPVRQQLVKTGAHSSSSSRRLLGSSHEQGSDAVIPEELVELRAQHAHDEKDLVNLHADVVALKKKTAKQSAPEPATLVQDDDLEEDAEDSSHSAAWTANEIERMSEDTDTAHEAVHRESWPAALRHQTLCFRKWSCGCFDRECAFGMLWLDWHEECHKAVQDSDECLADNSEGGCHEQYHHFLPHERKEKSHHQKEFNLGVHDGVVESMHDHNKEMTCGPLVLEDGADPVYEDGIIVQAHNFTH